MVGNFWTSYCLQHENWAFTENNFRATYNFFVICIEKPGVYSPNEVKFFRNLRWFTIPWSQTPGNGISQANNFFFQKFIFSSMENIVKIYLGKSFLLQGQWESIILCSYFCQFFLQLTEVKTKVVVWFPETIKRLPLIVLVNDDAIVQIN